MEPFDLIIFNGMILTMDEGMTQIDSGAVGVRNNRIEFVGKSADLPDTTATLRLDASGGIIMPGLVNTHTHLPMALFRGIADDLPLQTWLNDYIFPAENAHLNPETVRIGTLLSCAEMLLSGTTTCCDGYFFEDVVAEALAEVGMRGVLAQGVIDFPAPGVPNPKDNMKTAEDFLKKWKDRNSLVQPSIFCHSLYTCSRETLTAAKSASLKYDALFQIHAAETESELEFADATYQTTPFRFLNRLGILDSKTLLVHAVWMDDEEIALIAEKNAKVSHNPESNMKLGSGIAPVVKMLSAGVTVGLGTDGCASNNDMDLFLEMGSAAKLHKAVARNPAVMDAQTVLRMGTIGGARAIGLEDYIGSIEPGKAADILIIDTHKPRLTPSYDPLSLLVFAACGADVRDVILAGRVVVRDGRLQTMDLDSLIRDAHRVCRPIREISRAATRPRTR